MSETVYKTTPHIVAFIDILGATNAILKQADESLEVIHKIYESAVTAFPMFQEIGLERPKVKIFSDNIVVALPYDASRRKTDALLGVVAMSVLLQAIFLTRGWLTRGGIASGDFFMDDVMVWGIALVHAYELESRVAYFPRVVVAPSLVEEYNQERDIQHAKKIIDRFLGRDADGMIRLEILPKMPIDSNSAIFKIFDKGLFEKRLVEHHGDTKVCQKWRWMANHVEERRKILETEGGETNAKSDEKDRN